MDAARCHQDTTEHQPMFGGRTEITQAFERAERPEDASGENLENNGIRQMIAECERGERMERRDRVRCEGRLCIK